MEKNKLHIEIMEDPTNNSFLTSDTSTQELAQECRERYSGASCWQPNNTGSPTKKTDQHTTL